MSERKNIEQLVEEKFNEWKINYMIPFEDEFDVKEMIRLEIEYQNLSKENAQHVKTRSEILEMRNRLKNRLKILIKPIEKFEKYTFLVVGDKRQLMDLFMVIQRSVNDDSIKKRSMGLGSPNKAEIYLELSNGTTFLFYCKNDNQIRGMRINQYINLTGDLEFEEQILRPMLIK